MIIMIRRLRPSFVCRPSPAMASVKFDGQCVQKNNPTLKNAYTLTIPSATLSGPGFAFGERIAANVIPIPYFASSMLVALDIALTVLHLAIIGFNLFGWIPERTRRAHLIVAGLTLGSWVILGIWFGIGYCPITDWQWQVKARLGVRNLPPSYITWLAEKLSGRRFPDDLVNIATLGTFALAILSSLYFNFSRRRT